MAVERVQKIIAQAGIASRREAEQMIREGSVTINGRPAQLGDKAEWGKDAIKVQGKLLFRKPKPVYLALHKPKGMISMMSQDRSGRPTLLNIFSKMHNKLFPVGRLDFNGEGLLLLTNDGEFAARVQQDPELKRSYKVKIKGHPDLITLGKLERGLHLDGKMIKPIAVKVAQRLRSKSFVEITFQGSGAIDVKQFFQQKGFLVERVIRVAIGSVKLGNLLPGQFKTLKGTQLQSLLKTNHTESSD